MEKTAFDLLMEQYQEYLYKKSFMDHDLAKRCVLLPVKNASEKETFTRIVITPTEQILQSILFANQKFIRGLRLDDYFVKAFRQTDVCDPSWIDAVLYLLLNDRCLCPIFWYLFELNREEDI